MFKNPLKDKSKKPNTNTKPSKVSQMTDAKNTETTAKELYDMVHHSQHLKIGQTALEDIAKLQFLNPDNEKQMILSMPNMEEYKIIAQAFNDYNKTTIINGLKEISAFANASKKTLEELYKMEYPAPDKINSNNQPQQSTNSIDGIEKNALIVLQELNLWVNENKSDEFTKSIKSFVETETILIKEKLLDALRFIILLHPEFAKPIYISEVIKPMADAITEYVDFSTKNKLINTNEFYNTLSKNLGKIEQPYKNLQQANKDLHDLKYHLALKNSYNDVLELKNLLENTKLNVAKPEDITDLNYRAAAVLAHNTHKVLTASVSAAELMYRDILKHPRYVNMESEIKSLENQYKKLEVLRNHRLQQANKLLPPQANKPATEKSEEAKLTTNPTVKVKT